MPNSEIPEYLARLEKDIKQFKLDLFRIGWFMRGSITVEDLLHTYSYDEREMIAKIINENIENSVKAGLPLI